MERDMEIVVVIVLLKIFLRIGLRNKYNISYNWGTKRAHSLICN